jgi:hypothetical protein
VIGLAHDALKRAWPDTPPEIAQAICAQARAQVSENLAMAAEAVRLQRLFDAAKLPVLFVKGASLAVLAFGDLGLRGCKDIDLLVSYEALPAATALLITAGYRRFDPPPHISDANLRLLMPLRKDFGLFHEGTGLRVELHWRLFLNPHAMVEDSLMTASRVVPLTGTAVLRTLGEEDLFAYLMMHGAIHCWNQLKWLADIGALLAAASDSEAERFYRAAESRGVGRAAAQGMLLSERLLDTHLPASLLKECQQSRNVRWLEATALEAMTGGQGEQEPRNLRFGTTRGSLSALLLRRGWRYHLAELRNLLCNETDILTMPLPHRLRFLYPVIRLPFWFWRHATKARVMLVLGRFGVD